MPSTRSSGGREAPSTRSSGVPATRSSGGREAPPTRSSGAPFDAKLRSGETCRAKHSACDHSEDDGGGCFMADGGGFDDGDVDSSTWEGRWRQAGAPAIATRIAELLRNSDTHRDTGLAVRCAVAAVRLSNLLANMEQEAAEPLAEKTSTPPASRRRSHAQSSHVRPSSHFG